MPRDFGKKGIKEEDDFVVPTNRKSANDIHPASEAFIEQLLKDHPFWVKRGRKLTCSFCRITVHFSNLTSFKIEISTHMESHYHKKKSGTLITKKDSKEKTGGVEVEVSEINDKKKTHENEKQCLADIVKDVQFHVSNIKSTDKNQTKFNDNGLTDFETTYCSLEKDNPVTQASKKFIVKADDSNYFCTICQELIFNSLNANEFRHNLWTHLNNERHRERLPNFSKVERDFKKVIAKLARKIPDKKGDMKYFEIGPVFRFVKCSLCNVAVSVNLHRLENHIVGTSHQNNKEKGPKEYSEESRNKHTRNWFTRLTSQLKDDFKEPQFQEDLTHIHAGKMPGYVICSLCSKVVLPTPFYMKEHFTSDDHVQNKTANLIKWESTFKTDLMKALPEDFIDPNMFQETKGGIKCHWCNVTIPATSYALYCHMKESGCVFSL